MKGRVVDRHQVVKEAEQSFNDRHGFGYDRKSGGIKVVLKLFL